VAVLFSLAFIVTDLAENSKGLISSEAVERRDEVYTTGLLDVAFASSYGDSSVDRAYVKWEKEIDGAEKISEENVREGFKNNRAEVIRDMDMPSNVRTGNVINDRIQDEGNDLRIEINQSAEQIQHDTNKSVAQKSKEDVLDTLKKHL